LEYLQDFSAALSTQVFIIIVANIKNPYSGCIADRGQLLWLICSAINMMRKDNS
jgi:hypothetical protein